MPLTEYSDQQCKENAQNYFNHKPGSRHDGVSICSEMDEENKKISWQDFTLIFMLKMKKSKVNIMQDMK